MLEGTSLGELCFPRVLKVLGYYFLREGAVLLVRKGPEKNPAGRSDLIGFP